MKSATLRHSAIKTTEISIIIINQSNRSITRDRERRERERKSGERRESVCVCPSIRVCVSERLEEVEHLLLVTVILARSTRVTAVRIIGGNDDDRYALCDRRRAAELREAAHVVLHVADALAQLVCRRAAVRPQRLHAALQLEPHLVEVVAEPRAQRRQPVGEVLVAGLARLLQLGQHLGVLVGQLAILEDQLHVVVVRVIPGAVERLRAVQIAIIRRRRRLRHAVDERHGNHRLHVPLLEQARLVIIDFVPTTRRFFAVLNHADANRHEQPSTGETEPNRYRPIEHRFRADFNHQNDRPRNRFTGDTSPIAAEITPEIRDMQRSRTVIHPDDGFREQRLNEELHVIVRIIDSKPIAVGTYPIRGIVVFRWTFQDDILERIRVLRYR